MIRQSKTTVMNGYSDPKIDQNEKGRGLNMAEIKKDINENYIEEVKKALKEIKYGSLTLIIQDGKVIQIDKTEKVRL